MRPFRTLAVAAAFFASLNLVSAATIVFQIDFQMIGGASQETQAGWTSWDVAKTGAGASINNTVGGIGVAISALGTSGTIEARGGTADDRGGEITGTSWNDVVEDLIAARNGTGA